MTIAQTYLAELQQEAKTTRKMLERVPFDKKDWKPHAKSMTLGRLAAHVAELPGWTSLTIDKDELDFAKGDYKPVVHNSTEELVKSFDENFKAAEKALAQCSDETMGKSWSMRNGDQVYFTMPKAAVLRSFTFNHLFHHRGQLSVYLRLLDVPVPGTYGPTADEQ